MHERKCVKQRERANDAPPACARVVAARTAEFKTAHRDCAAHAEDGEFLPLAKWDVAPTTPLAVNGGCTDDDA
eukprot:1049537-Prorocentrum_lima.AAC.1